MTTINQPNTRIRTILTLDAITCLGAGVLMSLAAAPLATLTALNTDLPHLAGLALLPVAGLFFICRAWPHFPAGLSASRCSAILHG